MDSIDNFRERFEALEQQAKAMETHTGTIERRLRWWRGLACGLLVLGLLTRALPSGRAGYDQGDLERRVAELEYKLQYVSGGANEVVITRANLRIVNGLGATETTNGLGNLIVGYNEPRPPEITGPGSVFPPDNRTDSHNIIVGKENNFSTYGGLVVGELNEISGVFASVLAGTQNKALGDYPAVSGGIANFATGDRSAISGGARNRTDGSFSSISGGVANQANDRSAVVSGGINNRANGSEAVVCGGSANIASGSAAVVCGGEGNTASGDSSAVSGGENNTANGFASSVSGGLNRTAPGEHDWVAGPLSADF